MITALLRFTVEAHPGARQDRVSVVGGHVLAVWVRARPVDGQANAAIERAVAAALGVRPRQVRIVGGHAARRKILEVDTELGLAHLMRQGPY
jgi:uncharacterized protein